MRRFAVAVIFITLSISGLIPARAFQNENATPGLVGKVFANGQQISYLSMLSDEMGSRLTASASCRRAEEAVEAEMKRIGLANVRRESFKVPASWERGAAAGWIVSHGNRPLTVAVCFPHCVF